jgi:hypothetical protein
LSDQTELEIVNFINIIFGNRFFYEFMTTELFVDKDVSKTNETLHEECILKCRFSLFKMTFNLKGSVDQEFSFIVKMYKK